MLMLTLSLTGCNLEPLVASLLPVTPTLLPTPIPTSTSTPVPTPTATTTPVPTAISWPTPTLTPNSPINNVAIIDELGLDFTEKRVIEVYEQVSPAVVNITTQVLRRSLFFDIIPEEGAGSGFVIDTNGHILTNYHVIGGARQIEITFLDETTLPAQLIGADPRNDLALLKIDAPPELLIPVEFGTSANLQVGQRAIAIGNPFGQFGGTLTTGVISALERSLQGPDNRQITGIIQTDAAINSGNSGGPLLDSAGRVIGITTAIFSPSGTNTGVGFAVPVDTIQRVLPDILALGRYRHPWLGIRGGYKITPSLTGALKLPVEQGILLVELYGDSPLASLGIVGFQEDIIVGNQRIFAGGDILVAVDGQPLTSLETLQILLETQYQVGDVVTVTLYRNGQQFTLEATLTEEVE